MFNRNRHKTSIIGPCSSIFLKRIVGFWGYTCISLVFFVVRFNRTNFMIIRDVKQRWNKGIYWMSKSKPWLGCRYFLGAPTIPLVMDVLGSWSSFVLTWMGLYTYAFTSVCMCVLFLCRHDESWETYSILNWVLFCLPWEKYGGIHICFVFPYYNASSKWHCVYFNKHNVLIHVYTCISYIYITIFFIVIVVIVVIVMLFFLCLALWIQPYPAVA
jgi:hypothetical protein